MTEESKENLCDCGVYQKTDFWHCCPYEEEIHANMDWLCKCCEECQRDCAASV